MAQQTINLGAAPDDGTGDTLRAGGDKINDNFDELYDEALKFKGSTDCSTNPNYPAALKGDAYRVSVAGKIGGASGVDVEVADLYFATADNAGGDQATVGTSWSVLQGNITSYLPLSGGTLTGDLIVPDEAYDATNWDGNLEVPTKNAVRDKIESLSAGGAIEALDEGVSLTATMASIDFVGAGVTATNTGGDVTVTIPGGVSALDDLSDVNTAGQTSGDVLTYDGAGWVPGNPAMVLISEQSPSGTGVVTFSSIPATYRDLLLVVRGRGTTAATSVAALMTFNNDTGGNYDKERLTANNGTTVSAAGNAAATSIDMGGIAAASATADVADVVQAEIFDYRGTTFQKAVLTRNTTKTGTASTNLTQQVQSAWWRSTAAITEIDVTLNAGNFVAGSVVSLYGIM